MASVHRLLAAGARLPPAAALLARRPLALCGGGGLTAAAVAYALTQAAECEEAPKGSLRPLPGTAGGEGIARSQLREAIESGYLAGITTVGGLAILSILLLAWRTEAKSARAFAFVSLADSLINRNQAVVSRVGRVVSSGAYQLSFEPGSVGGWYQVESPTRRVKGVAHVTAVKAAAGGTGSGSGGGGFLAALRPAGSRGGADQQQRRPDWAITSLTLEFDRASLEEADVRRAAISAAAGYRKPEEVQAAADAAQAADVHSDDAERTRVVMRVV